MNSGTDNKNADGGIEEWLGMQSHLLMMTSVSFDQNWKSWNSFTFVSAVTGIWEEPLEAKVFEVAENGCPLSIGADTGFPIEVSLWFSYL